MSSSDENSRRQVRPRHSRDYDDSAPPAYQEASAPPSRQYTPYTPQPRDETNPPSSRENVGRVLPPAAERQSRGAVWQSRLLRAAHAVDNWSSASHVMRPSDALPSYTAQYEEASRRARELFAAGQHQAGARFEAMADRAQEQMRAAEQAVQQQQRAQAQQEMPRQHQQYQERRERRSSSYFRRPPQ
ncbi:hypothetical protein JCM10908_005782 [Rhodotorula pacifica]|uniref:uncharacterized protein n=1 Tax=Rhodotorula pacifica TaxID=1495444 RepID=UPI00316EC503